MANTIQAYHGSPNKFKEFSLDFIGTQSGCSGAGVGIYFTESEGESFTYGKNIFKCLLLLKNNLSNYEITINKNTLKKILDNLYLNFNVNYFENYGIEFYPLEKIETNFHLFDEIYNELINCLSSDTELIGNFINSGVKIENIFDILIELGYDHTIDVNESVLSSEGIKHYIIYDLKSIQILKQYNLNTRV